MTMHVIKKSLGMFSSRPNNLLPGSAGADLRDPQQEPPRRHDIEGDIGERRGEPDFRWQLASAQRLRMTAYICDYLHHVVRQHGAHELKACSTWNRSASRKS